MALLCSAFFFKLDLTDRSKHEMCKLNQQLKPAAILLSHSSFHNNCKQGDYENQFFCFFVDFCSIKLQERKWRKFNAGISLSYFGPKLEDQGASASWDSIAVVKRLQEWSSSQQLLHRQVPDVAIQWTVSADAVCRPVPDAASEAFNAVKQLGRQHVQHFHCQQRQQCWRNAKSANQGWQGEVGQGQQEPKLQCHWTEQADWGWIWVEVHQQHSGGQRLQPIVKVDQQVQLILFAKAAWQHWAFEEPWCPEDCQDSQS